MMRNPLFSKLLTVVAVLLAALLLPALLMAFPKPSIAPVAWELTLKQNTPKRIAVKTAGSDVPKGYWYMTFSVTNNTNAEQLFLPTFELMTKDGQVIRSDDKIPAEVFNAIKAREGIKDLLPMGKIAGRLLVGNDQAKDGVAIWPEPADVRLETFNVFVGGLSGETCYVNKAGDEVDVKDWAALTPEQKADLVVLHKTLQLTYQIPGDEINPGKDVVLDKGSTWVMR